ncbi:3-isopropylmalate dehydratase large subunit [Tepidanaerobacter acetatoxydans Re1]|uniref:3-isopropylmalate dehydratase large subunit n=1 Tax=Tepidanaerobacter acetatoxydans (strain DSM 21804 / JCM 16047 / Re1) TaxID=1209989 RepID=F4LQR4_TEPAE|nr:3-isopropylmalate dehydratase large subunit [Tepidanaerobacter acetatoxydans]AEE92067.1 3-isopropylmalate dehydratase large subunit [Tepidanaerobacter acetatoxydans Re1]CCP26911.1 3-isopropylmalate dehydratase large subunit [Tepidanaerobacter acetatoxydans Re1]
MGMTITQKILAKHSGKDFVEPGELVMAEVDLALANDITGPVAIEEFKKAGGRTVFDREKIALIPDHFAPNKDIKSAELCKMLREFAKTQQIKHYYEVGRMGIEHAFLPEQGIVLPGDLVVGADSHTCTYGALGAFSTGVGSTDLAFAMMTGKCWFKVPETIKFIYHGKPNPWVTGKDLILHTIGDIGVDGALYKAMEFTGDTIAHLTIDERLTMSNMAIEAGGKNGIMEPDEITLEYVKNRAKKPYEVFRSDPDAAYSDIIDYDVKKIQPKIALPHLPENVVDVEAVDNIVIDQVVIGSCTNGRLEDMRLAAKVLKGHKVHPYLRLIIIPATQQVYQEMIKEGITEIFVDAGAVVSTPTCGPCLGGYMGILAKGERAVATTNRNFVGRMGHPESEVYLSNPAVAAASAVKGRIAHPKEVVCCDI